MEKRWRTVHGPVIPDCTEWVPRGLADIVAAAAAINLCLKLTAGRDRFIIVIITIRTILLIIFQSEDMTCLFKKCIHAYISMGSYVARSLPCGA